MTLSIPTYWKTKPIKTIKGWLHSRRMCSYIWATCWCAARIACAPVYLELLQIYIYMLLHIYVILPTSSSNHLVLFYDGNNRKERERGAAFDIVPCSTWLSIQTSQAADSFLWIRFIQSGEHLMVWYCKDVSIWTVYMLLLCRIIKFSSFVLIL